MPASATENTERVITSIFFLDRCADTVAGNAITYETPGKGGVLEVVESFDDDVRVVEDERAGTFVITVPRYQPVHRRGCPYGHSFVAELGM